MKVLHVIFVQMYLLLLMARADESFHRPFQGIDAKDITEIEIKIPEVEQPLKISDQQWIAKFLGLITPKDYPVRKGPMGFSKPGEIARLSLRNADGKELVGTTLYGAWNLMETGSTKSRVLGSNRQLAALILNEIGKHYPKKLKAWKATYRDQISGTYQKEYRDFMTGAQGSADKLAKVAEKKVKNEKKHPITHFSFGGVGIAGSISEGEYRFGEAVSSKNPKDTFEQWHKKGNAMEKAYCMVGFYYVDRKRYHALKPTYLKSKAQIQMMSGCIVMTITPKDLLIQIEKDRFKPHFDKPAKRNAQK